MLKSDDDSNYKRERDALLMFFGVNCKLYLSELIEHDVIHIIAMYLDTTTATYHRAEDRATKETVIVH